MDPKSLVKPLKIIVLIFVALTLIAGVYVSFFSGPPQLTTVLLVTTLVLALMYVFVKSNAGDEKK